MKPVAVFRYSDTEGPGHFATFLDANRISWLLVKLDEGDPVPPSSEPFRGLAFMGGPMSANDDLPWVRPMLELVREAVRKDLPALGHCLGGQLMAKALGGEVSRARVKEIGWGEVQVADNGVAREWFGTLAAFESFHCMSRPSAFRGGTRGRQRSRANQAFALGRHLGMQCHVEMTEELIRSWCKGGADEIEAAKASPGVQSPARIVRNVAERVAALHRTADRIYDRWTEGLARG